LRILENEYSFKEKIEELAEGYSDIQSIEENEYLQNEDLQLDLRGGVTISFPPKFFRKLFYECEIGRNILELGYIEFNDSVFVEYKESTALSIAHLTQPFSQNIVVNGKSIDIFIDPGGEYYLNDEEYEKFYDYFIYTLKFRIVKHPVVYPVNRREYKISDFLTPIFYLVRVEKDIDYILPSLNYYLARDLGICPINNKDIPKAVVFGLEQNIDKIYDCENDVFLPEERTKGTQAINYYLKALNELDPLYQFLDFYHVIETFCYDYIWDYYTNLSREPKEKFEELVNFKKNKNFEEEVIKKTFIALKERHPGEFNSFKERLDSLNGGNRNENGKLNGFIGKLNENITGEKIAKYKNWNDDRNDDKYFENLGRFIFKIRSEIAHRKIQRNPITLYTISHYDVIAEINKIMKEIAEIIIEEKEFINE
jgi:hypothetical protein